MIQRKQTLFLLLAAICLGVAVVMSHSSLLMTIVLCVAALGAIGIIFLYKNRKRQAAFTLPIMALILAWYIIVAATTDVSTLKWYDALPLVALLLTFLARKSIISDEKLVRSLDRIR